MRNINLNNEAEKKELFDVVARHPAKEIVERVSLDLIDEAPLLRVLGIPLTQGIFKMLYHGSKWGNQYSDFLLELIGVAENQIPEGGFRSPANIVLHEEPTGREVTVNLWRKRVWVRNTLIKIREIYNPSLDLQSPLSLALGGIGWVTAIRRINPAVEDIVKEVSDAQKVALGFLVLREATEQTRYGKPLAQIKAWTDEAVDRYAREQTKRSTARIVQGDAFCKTLAL